MTDLSAADDAALDAWWLGELDERGVKALAERMLEDLAFRRAVLERQRLLNRVRALPRDVEPPADLWPTIAARLEEPAASSPPARREPPVDRRAARSPWPRQIAAAVAGALAGGLLAWGALIGQPAGGPAPAAAGASLASFGDGLDPRGQDLSTALEADFLRARETLWVGLLARRDQLPPEIWEAVVVNLAILDDAIRDLRIALDDDPGNRRLEKMLLANHQRQLDLLHRLSRGLV
ncbi:MAG: hypothetical protein AAF725_22535 [Acidobacteriota bacterium]